MREKNCIKNTQPRILRIEESFNLSKFTCFLCLSLKGEPLLYDQVSLQPVPDLP